MEVKAKISGYDQMQAATIAAVVSPWIKNFAAQCGLNDQNVGQFVIADESHYAAAIQTISKSELFTNTNSLLGVGKTIVACDERDTVRCDVVVRAEIASMMMEGVESGKPMDQWQLNSQIGAYVVAHELGHCRDYCERLDDDADNAPLDTSTFRIAHFAKYYGRIAVSEYAASYFASSFVTQPLFDQFIVNDVNTVGSAVDEAHELRRNYRRTDELFQLACTAASAYWLAIIQAAKVFGIRKGNPALRDVPLNWSKWFLSNGGGTMDALEKRLSVLWGEYPHLEGFWEACHDCWAEITLADGFKFSPNLENDANTGDGLYFDTVSLHDLIRRTRR